jgi:diguanylate cyclase (GGDEF)-like protein
VIARRPRDQVVPVVLAALLLGYAVLPLGSPRLHLWYDVTAVLAMLAGFWGVYRHRPAHPRGWVLTLLGFSGWVVADVMWFAETAGGDEAFPAPSDGVALLSYPLLGAGVLIVVRTRRSGGDRAAFLDASIFTTGITVLVAVFLIAPLANHPTLGPSARIVSTAYPMGDVFLVAALARMLTSPGARNRSYRLLLASLIVTCIADIAWNLQVVYEGDTGSGNRLINLGWLAGYVLVGVAASSSTMALVAEPTPPGDDVPPFGRRRVVGMAIGLLLPALVLVVDGITDGDVAWPLLAAGSAVMSVLVLARFVDLLSVVQTQAVQLAALARTDALTGVPNRRSWDHELSRAAKVARDSEGHLAVAVLDLDRFKVFNDTHGHQAGDQLLHDAATAWRSALPAGAVLARYGGEEFAVLLPGYRLEQAEGVIARLKGRTPAGQTFSAGICEWRVAGRPDSPAALVAQADRALYRAKKDGRDRIVLAPPSVAGVDATGQAAAVSEIGADSA